jgi:hypothetical protein
MHDEVNLLRSGSRRGEPTDASPGSEDKIRVMAERASRREPLFHPLDNLGPRPLTERAKWSAKQPEEPVAVEELLEVDEPVVPLDCEQPWEELANVEEEIRTPLLPCPEEAGLP